MLMYGMLCGLYVSLSPEAERILSDRSIQQARGEARERIEKCPLVADGIWGCGWVVYYYVRILTCIGEIYIFGDYL